MQREKSTLSALVLGKCPQCHGGEVFEAPLLHVHKFTKMNKVCSHCGFNFEPEPMFYFGAMYISYAFSVAALVASYLAIRLLVSEPPLWSFIVSVPLVVLLTLPFNFRYSRLIYLFIMGNWRKG